MDEWIDINDKIPNPDEFVIGYCKSYPKNFVTMVFTYRNGGHIYFWNDFLDEKAIVTHWMSLPDPPENISVSDYVEE